jgi:hypothetical protein
MLRRVGLGCSRACRLMLLRSEDGASNQCS